AGPAAAAGAIAAAAAPAAPPPAPAPAAPAAAPVPTPPVVIPAAPAAPAVAPPAAAPPPIASGALVPIPQIGEAEFEKFLLEAPFPREAKSLLRLIARKAPLAARTRALNVAMSQLPQIVFDPARAGADLRGALLVEGAAGSPKTFAIALSPGP